MNQEQLRKDIEEMKARLASMESELNSPKQFPKKGDIYYFIATDGEVLQNNAIEEKS